MKQYPTPARLRELLQYDPGSGVVRWRVHRPPVVAGDVAGCLDSKGYMMIGVDLTQQRLHRVIWALVTGKWPDHEIDHRNGATADNRWRNLREATHKQNHENRDADSRSTSGFRGVSWDRPRQRWQARIEHHARVIRLGRHDNLLDAVAARMRAERDLFTHHREIH
jgi:hypothetical protein